MNGHNDVAEFGQMLGVDPLVNGGDTSDQRVSIVSSGVVSCCWVTRHYVPSTDYARPVSDVLSLDT